MCGIFLCSAQSIDVVQSWNNIYSYVCCIVYKKVFYFTLPESQWAEMTSSHASVVLKWRFGVRFLYYDKRIEIYYSVVLLYLDHWYDKVANFVWLTSQRTNMDKIQ